MNHPSPLIATILISSLCFAGVGKNNVRYLGGTKLNSIKSGSEGDVLQADHAVAFQFGDESVQVDYKQITSLEYGQKVGRRVGATVALGVTTLGLAALPMLLSKKRKHFATIGYKDKAGETQALILEFGKDINRSILKVMSVKSGVKIEFESEQAEKEFRH